MVNVIKRSWVILMTSSSMMPTHSPMANEEANSTGSQKPCVCGSGPIFSGLCCPGPEKVQLSNSLSEFLISHQSICHYNTAWIWASHAVQDYSVSSTVKSMSSLLRGTPGLLQTSRQPRVLPPTGTHIIHWWVAS